MDNRVGKKKKKKKGKMAVEDEVDYVNSHEEATNGGYIQYHAKSLRDKFVWESA